MSRVDVVTGFLGAGKTTFLARYCQYLRKKKIDFSVIENEFGAAGVDQAVLRESKNPVGELSGGCICCTMKVGFYQMLEEQAGIRERVLIEPSGIFNMDDFFEITDALELRSICEMGMCLTIVDIMSVSKLDEKEKTILRGELTGTGMVLWSHADKLSSGTYQRAEETVRSLLEESGTTLWFYEKPLHLLNDADFAVLENMTPIRRAHVRMPVNHAALYQSASLSPKGVYRAEDVLAVLERVMKSGECGNIVRVKGFVRTENNGMLAVNGTRSSRSAVPSTITHPMLNIIGGNIDRKRFRMLLEQIAR